MITLGCKTIDVDDLIKCSFDIGKTEMSIMSLLMQENGMTSQEISSRLEKDITTVQKSLKVLSEKGLVVRQQENLGNGGYKFIYSAVPSDRIKSMIMKNLDNFKEKVLESVERI